MVLIYLNEVLWPEWGKHTHTSITGMQKKIRSLLAGSRTKTSLMRWPLNWVFSADWRLGLHNVNKVALEEKYTTLMFRVAGGKTKKSC